MARPKGTKNVMRTPEEKEEIVLEASRCGIRPTAVGWISFRHICYTNKTSIHHAKINVQTKQRQNQFY